MASPTPNRRSFLNYCTDFLMLMLGLLLVIPAFGYFLTPILRKEDGEGSEEGFVDVGRVVELPVGNWHLVSLEKVQQDGWKKSKVKHAIWVRRSKRKEEVPRVLSTICPHLGCPVNWQPSQAQFVCPCHKGVFDVNGTKMQGPPPRSMDELEAKIVKGRLLVRWQDFKIGIGERIPLNA